jgi:hypothetical protein
MQQLLSIESVPISIEYKHTESTAHTTVNPIAKSARLRISKASDSVTIKSNPISIKMDSFKTAGSDSIDKNPLPSSLANLSYSATARYSDSGNLQLDIHVLGDPIQDIDYKRVQRSIENVMSSLSSNIDDLPSAGKDMRINFQTSALSVDSSTMQQSNIKFLPGNLEFNIKEYPKLIIKYVGGPIYIPRSSDPDYVPPEKLDIFV